MQRLTLATSRYHAPERVLACGLAPVGITVSPPRFRLGFELAGSVGALAPHGILGLEDPEEFARLYLARLDGYGVERIAAALGALAGLSDAQGCVLLCYEDLETPGEWCHRRLFAQWWLGRTGIEVPELASR